MGETSVVWRQAIDDTPKARMESLGRDPEKWTDFFGSTELQRFAADSFASKNNGTVKRRGNVNIHVEYTQQIGVEGRYANYPRVQYFRKDGTPIPQEGEIKQLDQLSPESIEMWLDSPSENNKQVIAKILGSVGYSTINSPKVLLTGRTWSGRPTYAEENMDALIDVGPGFVLKGLTSVKTVSKVAKKATRGLERYNDFVSKNPILRGNAELPSGVTWQTNAGRAYRTNMQNVKMIDDADKTLETLDQTVGIYENIYNKKDRQ